MQAYLPLCGEPVLTLQRRSWVYNGDNNNSFGGILASQVRLSYSLLPRGWGEGDAIAVATLL